MSYDVSFFHEIYPCFLFSLYLLYMVWLGGILAHEAGAVDGDDDDAMF